MEVEGEEGTQMGRGIRKGDGGGRRDPQRCLLL